MTLQTAVDDAGIDAGCCSFGSLAAPAARSVAAGADPRAYAVVGDDGVARLDAVVETLDCPSCVPSIEGTLARLDGVLGARVNAGQRRIHLEWDPARVDVERIVAALDDLGHRIAPYDAARIGGRDVDEVGQGLLRALAVAGFAFANVMLV